jgi:kynurenine formamidase
MRSIEDFQRQDLWTKDNDFLALARMLLRTKTHGSTLARSPYAPFVHTKERYGRTRDASLIWEGHRAGMEIGYCHLEKLHNLEALPATGFTVCCFPFSIKGASAGFTRAVAIVED